jgi:hypothetical protein
MDFFDAVNNIRKAYPSIDEDEIRAAMDSEVKSEEEKLKGRNVYRRAVESAYVRILDWLANGHEDPAKLTDLESIAHFVALHRQAAAWAIIQSKHLHSLKKE